MRKLSDQLKNSRKHILTDKTCSIFTETEICSHNGKVFSVEPPLFVELAITETEPGFKGDTAQGATKPATVETGAIVMVPLFVEQGDVLKIDTRSGEYLSRV